MGFRIIGFRIVGFSIWGLRFQGFLGSDFAVSLYSGDGSDYDYDSYSRP